jgi:hypothetical protein
MYVLKSLNAHCKVQTYPMSLEIQTVYGGAVGILLTSVCGLSLILTAINLWLKYLFQIEIII